MLLLNEENVDRVRLHYFDMRLGLIPQARHIIRLWEEEGGGEYRRMLCVRLIRLMLHKRIN